MNLTDLEALEAEYQARGYRVAFERFEEAPAPLCAEEGSRESAGGVIVGGGWVRDELTRDDDTGWPTAEEAEEYAAKLRKVGGKDYRNIRVSGPDGEDVHTTAASAPGFEFPPDVVQEYANQVRPLREFGKTRSNPMRDANAEAVIAAAEAGTPADEAPPDPDARRVVDGIPAEGGVVLLEEGGVCLVGDQNAQVYACPLEAVQGKPGISWKPKVKRFEHVVVGTDGEIPWLNWRSDGGVTVRAAFHSPSGQWFTLRK